MGPFVSGYGGKSALGMSRFFSYGFVKACVLTGGLGNVCLG